MDDKLKKLIDEGVQAQRVAQEAYEKHADKIERLKADFFYYYPQYTVDVPEGDIEAALFWNANKHVGIQYWKTHLRIIPREDMVALEVGISDGNTQQFWVCCAGAALRELVEDDKHIRELTKELDKLSKEPSVLSKEDVIAQIRARHDKHNKGQNDD